MTEARIKEMIASDCKQKVDDLVKRFEEKIDRFGFCVPTDEK
jgi:hypothetical protein